MRMRYPDIVTNLREVLPAGSARQLLILGVAMAFGSVLETLGIGLLIPLVGFILAGGAKMPAFASDLMASMTAQQRAVASAGGTFAIGTFLFLLKNAFLAAHAWMEARFAFSLQAKLSSRLMADLLESEDERRWAEPPGRNAALVTLDVASVVIHSLLPLLTAVAEILFIAVIASFLFWIAPAITAAVLASASLAAVIYSESTRQFVRSLGQRRQSLETEGLARLGHAFAGLREINIYGAAPQVSAQFRSLFSDLARVHRSFQLVSTLPRFALELLAVACILAIAAAGIGSGQPPQEMLVQIGLFAASGFRILIGANRLMMSVQSMRYGRAALSRVVVELRRHDGLRTRLALANAPAPIAHVDTLAFADVSYRYAPDASHEVLSQVSLELAKGQVIGLVGKSGAGKSTLLDLLAGLRRPTSGRILLNGQAVDLAVPWWRKHLGYVSQAPMLFPETLRANIALGVAAADVDPERLAEAIVGARLGEFVAELPDGLDTLIAEDGVMLSGGQRQRVAIARALYRRPDVLLLDEPTSALDAATEQELMSTLLSLRSGRIIVIASHRPAPLALCDSILRLAHGRIDSTQLS